MVWFMSEPTPKRPSAIFAERLRATRKARGISLDQLSRAMSDAGRSVSKASLVRLELAEREPRLDEALALARVLGTAPALLLSPSDDERVSVTSDTTLDGTQLREWFRHGMAREILVLGDKSPGKRMVESMTLAIAADAARNLTDAQSARDTAGAADALRALKTVLNAYSDIRDGGDDS